MTESALLSPIARNVLGDEIIRRLVGYILEAGLKPGDRLPSERELQSRFAVGRSSMREAIKSLAALGLVEVRSGTGMFVGSGEPIDLTRGLPWGLLLSEYGAREVVEARQVVGPALAAFAAERATSEELAAIGAEIEEMRASVGDMEEYIRANVEFRLAIARAAHSSVLGRVFVSLQHLVRLWTRRTFAPFSLPQHEAIYLAVASGDPTSARREMVKHLRATYERLFQDLPAAGNAEGKAAGEVVAGA